MVWLIMLEIILGLLLMATGTYLGIALAESKTNHERLSFCGIACALLSIVIIILMFHIQFAYIYPMFLKIR